MFKKMKFQDVHIDQNIQQRTIIQDLTFDGCLFENIDFTKVSLKHLDLIDVTLINVIYQIKILIINI